MYECLDIFRIDFEIEFVLKESDLMILCENERGWLNIWHVNGLAGGRSEHRW